MSTGIEPTITLTDEGEWWVATDTETGVTSQGRTREAALENLDNAIAAYEGDGRPPTDAELEAIGIDPADNKPGRGDLPDILKDPQAE